MARLRPGAWGWLGLAVYVAVVDAILLRRHSHTLSEVFGDALKHPSRRIPVITIWGVLTMHLFAELLPPGIRARLSPLDPIGALARLIERA